ncbi:MAG: hypothetical protein F6K54_16940 [Okeania sp. SIO3B5]|uniref:hypothetical protein n=1 Tax=Okeania sp. SIO3B5 TaxID=2607811 RepID=UPI0014009E94|nr:hypothetical protein [Okeania sp. SIO3B5]NEO54618.1 hypothetical protein [Okeania sp. SIO3B5]
MKFAINNWRNSNNDSTINLRNYSTKKKEERRRKKEEGRGKHRRCLSFKLLICPRSFLPLLYERSPLYLVMEMKSDRL